MRTLWLLFFLGFIGWTSGVCAQTRSTAGAEPPGLAGARAAQLERALAELAATGASSTSSALANFAFGVILTGAGTWALLHNPDDGDDGARVAFGAVCLTFGGLSFAAVVRAIAGQTTTDEERWTRFQAARRAGPLDELTLSRFEGELAAEAAVARSMRVGNGVGYAGLAIAGGGVVALAAVGEFDGSARSLAYVEGGLLIALGVWQAIAQLTGEWANERVWREYRAASSPPAAQPLALSLHALPGSVQVQLASRF